MLRGLWVTEDGKHRVHQVNVDGVAKVRIEAAGPPGVWYHVADVRTPQEVARHIDLASLREV